MALVVRVTQGMQGIVGFQPDIHLVRFLQQPVQRCLFADEEVQVIRCNDEKNCSGVPSSVTLPNKARWCQLETAPDDRETRCARLSLIMTDYVHIRTR